MAPRGRKNKAGLTREDAARDAMRAFGFAERLITVSIKELLEVYGEGGWFLIEDCNYIVLLNKCLEKSDEQKVEIVEAEQEQNHVMVEAEQEQTPQQEEEKEQEHEQEHQVEDGRDHVGSNSTSLVGCVAETGTQTYQSEALSITCKTYILDSSPAGEASVIDYDTSPVAFPSANASGGFAQHSVKGAKSSGYGGWLSEDEDSDPDADSVGDDEIIQLTPQPLCEELEELIKEIRGEKKRKRPTRWED